MSKKAGPPRRWHAGVRVSPYSIVNVRNGDLFTSVPLFGWSGRGPSVSMSLYHNSLSTVSGLFRVPGSGVLMGKGWSHSYGAQLYFKSATLTYLIEDDGLLKAFELQNGVWVPEAGVYDVLEADGSEWRVTYKDQSYCLFSSAGRLLKVGDASGNEVVLTYETVGTHTRIDYVTDAAGRQFEFHYDQTSSKLASITAELTGMGTRTWTFTYNASNELEIITDTMNFETEFVYDSAGRIRRVIDPNDNYHLVTYTDGKVSQVDDPAPLDGQHVAFAYGDDTQNPFTRTFTDRRNNDWLYSFDNPGDNLISVTNPLSQSDAWTYDANHNRLTHTNALNKVWTFTYDTRGNLLTSTDPLGHRTTLTWDTLNNLSSVAPPLNDQGDANTNKMVTFDYDDGDNPTRVTTITQPPAEAEGDPAITTLTYYGPQDNPDWTGNLKEVVDPNGVSTTFTYDEWGQLEFEHEGPFPGPGGGGAGGVSHYYDFNEHTWPLSLSGPFSDGGIISYDANGRATGSTCATQGGGGGYSFGSTPYLGFPTTAEALTGYVTPLPATWTYDNAGRVLSATGGFAESFTNEEGWRSAYFSYDSLNRVTTTVMSTLEATWDQPDPPELLRQFSYSYEDGAGTSDRIGPDNRSTTLFTDGAGRPVVLDSLDHVSVFLTYDDAGRLTQAFYLSGARVDYEYDDANRLTVIHHREEGGGTLLRLEYAYTPDGLVASISESDAQLGDATVTFTYDNHNRLTHEVREPAQGASQQNPAYDLAYTYDAGGNRLTKHDALNNVTTVYHYDIEDQETYGTRNNRLMWYAVSQNGQDVEKVYYAYHAGGHADQIIRKAAGDATYYRTYFLYDKQGRTWMVVKDQWQLDGQTGEPVNAQRTWAREFRYAGSGRQRYLTRARDPQTLLPASAADGLWSDYDGEGVYGDYAVDVGTGTAEGSTLTQYEPGLWQRDTADPQTPLDYYFHGDLIGSTRAMSDGEGSAVQRVIYTAFGERVWSDGSVGTRYGYAGAWGYEGGGVWGEENELEYLHVGERLYDPATGRFLQRDPIALRGGFHAYCYTLNSPTFHVDPSGLTIWEDLMDIGGMVTGVGCAITLACGGVAVPGGNIALVGGCIWGAGAAGNFANRHGWISAWINSNYWKEIDAYNRRNPRHPIWICFVAGTVVETPDGHVPIEDVAECDHVVSSDPSNQRTGVAAVNRVYCGFTRELVHIQIEHERLSCTPAHPFWVSARGWVSAGKLRSGDVLRSSEGKEFSVLSVDREQLAQPVEVFTLEIDSYHTFSVGYSSIVVHNKQ